MLNATSKTGGTLFGSIRVGVQNLFTILETRALGESIGYGEL